MKFAMLINDDEPAWAALTPAEMEVKMRDIFGWFEKWGATGKIADGGAQLEKSHTARTVRAGEGGAPVVTDGPYLELKEVIGGFVILETADQDEAVRIASTWPYLELSSIEIRPIVVHG